MIHEVEHDLAHEHEVHVVSRGTLEHGEHPLDIDVVLAVQNLLDECLLDVSHVHLAKRVLIVVVFLAGAREHERLGAVELLVLPRLHGHILAGGWIGQRDRLGHVDRHAAESVDEVLELRERDHDVVRHLDARELLDRFDHVFGIVLEERVVDLRRLAGYDRIARDRDERDRVRVGVDAHEREDV